MSIYAEDTSEHLEAFQDLPRDEQIDHLRDDHGVRRFSYGALTHDHEDAHADDAHEGGDE